MFEVNVTFTENVAGSAETAANTLDFSTREHVENSLNIFAETIQRKYDEVPYYYSEWVRRKERAGLPTAPLHYLEDLYVAVITVRNNMRHEEGPKGEHRVIIDAFKNTPYVQYSEKGASRKGKNIEPERPFIIPACEEWGSTVEFEANAIGNATAGIVDRGVGPTTETHILRGMHLVPRWAFWVLPLPSLYLFFGMYSDITSSLKGSFLNPGAARAWVLAYFQGRFFVTKKKLRRGFRRELWRR